MKNKKLENLEESFEENANTEISLDELEELLGKGDSLEEEKILQTNEDSTYSELQELINKDNKGIKNEMSIEVKDEWTIGRA